MSIDKQLTGQLNSNTHSQSMQDTVVSNNSFTGAHLAVRRCGHLATNLNFIIPTAEIQGQILKLLYTGYYYSLMSVGKVAWNVTLIIISN